MERAVVLDRLRKSGTFPKNFEDPKYESQRAVIRWLLKRKPDQRYVCIQKVMPHLTLRYRPTAFELLSSPLLPREIFGSNGVENLMTTLSSPESTDFARLINALFSKDRNGRSRRNYHTCA